MSNKKKLIILGVLSVLIILVLVLGITRAFMKPIEETSSITEVSLSSCAKIRLTGTNSINLSNSYPMSRNKGLQTTPYSFTVSSSCDTTVGFNLYIATLNTNTLDASEIHYIVTNKGSKDALAEGVLSNALEDSSSFSDSEKTELNTGLHGTFSKIYKIHNESIPLSGSKDYDLYLFLDENSTNTSQGKTFNAGVAIKSYDRGNETLADVCHDGDNLSNCIKSLYTSQGANNLYLHDNSLTNGAKDNSYRYAGSSETTNNFICFGYDSQDGSCPNDNLYRIIGVFGDEVKLIKYDYAKSTLLGTDGDYSNTYKGLEGSSNFGTNKGQNSKAEIGGYYWNYSNGSSSTNDWSLSRLNTVNLNKNYINKIDENGTKWSEKISDHIWKVGGNTYDNISKQTPPNTYQNEINSPATNKTVNAKVGLMYVSDYGYAVEPSAWGTTLYRYDAIGITNKSWMYMGLVEWTLAPRTDDSKRAFYVGSTGGVSYSVYVGYEYAARPVLYLKSTIGYGGGSGTAAKPILVK